MRLRVRELLQSEINDLLEYLFRNGMIERNTNGTFGEAIVMELVFERLYHLAAIGIDADVLLMSVKSKKGLALVFEGRHPIDDRFFCVWHGLSGKSANALKLLPFRRFNLCQIVVYYCHKTIMLTRTMFVKFIAHARTNQDRFSPHSPVYSVKTVSKLLERGSHVVINEKQ